MKKISKRVYEDSKGFLRVAETVLEVALLTMIYYWTFPVVLLQLRMQ